MFKGTTPPEVKVVIQDILSRTVESDVYSACSGNYTNDKMASAMGFKVHSNDVSLYSKIIADTVMGKDTTPVTVKDPILEDIFNQWENHRFKKLAMVMFVMRIANLLPQKNEYQIEMLKTFLQQKQADAFYSSTIEKLSKGALDFKIEDFYFGDFVEFLKVKKGKGIGIAFPPTYKGGYEKMFKAIEEKFDYEHASYNVFDPDTAGLLYLSLLKDDKNIIFTDQEFDEIADFKTAEIKLGQSQHPIFLYSSVDDKRKSYYIERDKKPLVSKYTTMPVDYEFTEDTKISVKMVPKEDVNYFKGFYMSNKVNYTDGGDMAFIFFADGLAFGFTCFSHYSSTLDTAFGLADFVVNSHTKKLSKLLIMLELSHDVRMLLARNVGDYYDYIKTPVYTDKPVSMKYRGIFKLTKKERGKLVYTGEFVKESINEIYKIWLKKYKK